MKVFPLRRIKRKGDLNLSINAVVVLILAIVMLGLGLGFIRNMFGKTTKELSDISEDIKNQVISEIEKQSERLIFLKYDISVNKGEKKEMYYGIKNNIDASTADSKTFQIKLGKINAVCEYDVEAQDSIPCQDAIQIGDQTPRLSDIKISTFGSVTAKGGEVKVMKLIVEPRPDSVSTTYKCSVHICTEVPDPESPGNFITEITSKDIMITVP